MSIKNKFLVKSNLGKVLSGSLLGQLIALALTPAITRIYSPAEYGSFGIFLAVCMVLGSVGGGRFEQAIVQAESLTEAIDLLVTSLFISTILLMCSLIVLAYAFFVKDLPSWIIFVPTGFMIILINQGLMNLSNKQQNYSLLSKARFVQIVIVPTCQLIAYYLLNNSTVEGLVLGFLLGNAITFIFLAGYLYIFMQDYKLSRIRLYKTAAKYKDFLKFNLPANLLNVASVQIPIILFGNYFSPALAGSYALANRVLNLPMGMIGSSVATVFAGEIAKSPADMAYLNRTTVRYLKVLCAFSVPITIASLFYGEHIFAYIFGDEWRKAGRYASYLSVWFMFVFISSPLSTLLNILNKHKENLAFNAGLFLSRLLTILCGYFIVGEEDQTILLFGIVGAIIWFGFLVYIVRLSSVRR